MNNWIGLVSRKVCANIGFYYLPMRIIVIIPKEHLQNNLTLLNITTDTDNVYLEFDKNREVLQDGLETLNDRKEPAQK